MTGLDKTIADAQAFIDSMKEFDHEHIGSDVHSTGDSPLGSVDYSLQGDLNSKGIRQPEGNPINTDMVGPDVHLHHGTDSVRHSLKSTLSKDSTSPVGNKNGFGTINFSRRADYEQPFRADVLTFIEVYYYENKKLPLVHELHETFRDHPDRPNFLKGWNSVLDDISDSLKNRGIKPYNTVDNYIDPKFAWATSLIVNHLDKRTTPQKLKEAGLSTKEWQAFLRRKRHYEYFQSRLDEVFTQDVKNDAKLALSRSIQNGDLQAIKYYNELQNIYRPETQSAVQMVSIILTAVMEILAQNVSSDVLNRVAAEIRAAPSVRKVIEAQSS
jgi:hypothetical protein